MRRFIVMVGLVVVGVACGSGADMLGEILDSGVPDAGADPGDGTSMQYVGNSDDTFSGRSAGYYDDENNVERPEGIFDYYAACQSTFGPGHRMCTLNEIIFTTKIPQLNEGDLAWVNPNTTCSSQTQSRAAVDHRGRFVDTRCPPSTNDSSPLLPIACCGPK